MEWKIVVLLLGVLVIFGGVVLVMVMNPTDEESCRFDALNAMCQRYGNRSGWATKVYESNGGFWVECTDDPVIEWGEKWMKSQS